jgi:hypothetical protein
VGENDLTQCDLSGRPIAEMTAGERAEMRRRYEFFLHALRRKPATPAPNAAGASDRPPGARKWHPPRAR